MRQACVGRAGVVHHHINAVCLAVTHQLPCRLQGVTLGAGGHLYCAPLCSNFIGDRTAFKKEVKEIVMGRVLVNIPAQAHNAAGTAAELQV